MASMDDLKTMAAGAVNTGVEQLHKLHDKLDANLALALVVGGMAVIGAMKAIGKMPHPASRMIGRGELLGAMFMILPRIILKGFGRVAGCCVIFAVMGAMMVGAVPHKDITSKIQWEAIMAFFIAHGLVLGLGVRIFAVAQGAGKVGGAAGGGAKKADSKKRTKRA